MNIGNTIIGIRDDDTNYFTNPEELNFAYGDIWGKCPVTLAVVPYIKGNWKYWVTEIEKNNGMIDWEAYRNDDQIFPIGENKVLVNFLKEKIKEKKISVSIHGIHHRNNDAELPKIKNNYAGPAEFVTIMNLKKQLLEAKLYLEELLNTSINSFVAPQNILSKQGLKAVSENKLNIVRNNYFPIYPVFDHITIREAIKFIGFKIQNRHKTYPYCLNFKNHKEITHYWIKLNTDLEQLKTQFDFIHLKKGAFILSSHYYGFNQTAYNGYTIKENFIKIFDYIESHENISFGSIDEIFSYK